MKKANLFVVHCLTTHYFGCDTLEEELFFYEKYGGSFPSHAIMNCVKQKSGNSELGQRWIESCAKCALFAPRPKPN